MESGCGHMFRVEYLEGSQPGFTSTVYVYCGKWTRSGVRNMFWSRPTFAIHRYCVEEIYGHCLSVRPMMAGVEDRGPSLCLLLWS